MVRRILGGKPAAQPAPRRNTKKAWTPPWVNLVSPSDPFQAPETERASRSVLDQMQPTQIKARLDELDNLRLKPGQKILAKSLDGKLRRGFFSRHSQRTGYFYMRGMDIPFDPRHVQQVFRMWKAGEHANIDGQKPIHMIMSTDGSAATVQWGGKEHLVYLERLTLVPPYYNRPENKGKKH